ncbi:MAG: hypothetical protein IJF20_02780 [Clostridia bacterium]|nr:hypothetical protein [Clostridia bacterium]
MSTSKKKTIKFTALMTVLILTVAYFSLLTPTSAYFYQEFNFENDGITFSLLDFDVTEDNEIFKEDCNLKFKGATKFADFDEKLFDEVVITKNFTITNVKNGVPAKVFPRIHLYEGAGDKGLKYMVSVSKTPFDSPTPTEVASEEGGVEETTTEKTEIPKGPIKSEIENKLGLFPGEATSVDYSIADSTLAAYNAPENHIVELAPGESVYVKIYFWVEYDKVMSAAGETTGKWQDAESVVSVPYKCSIEFIASQLSEEYSDEAVTEALNAEAPTWKETTIADNQ